MRRVEVVEAEAGFTALLAAVEAGETVAITRHGKVIARLVPGGSRSAADVFAPFWAEADEIDLVAPLDAPLELAESSSPARASSRDPGSEGVGRERNPVFGLWRDRTGDVDDELRQLRWRRDLLAR